MSTVTNVRQAPNAQSAMLALAQGVDKIIELLESPPKQKPAGDWFTASWGEEDRPLEDLNPWGPPEAAARTRIEIDGDLNAVVDVPVAPPERMAARRVFEQQRLHLADHLPEGEDWTEAYAKGGPLWLYYGNRELVMTYPRETRELMVMDIEMDSPEEAHEVARDILKHAGETGPGSPAMGTDVFK